MKESVLSLEKTTTLVNLFSNGWQVQQIF